MNEETGEMGQKIKQEVEQIIQLYKDKDSKEIDDETKRLFEEVKSKIPQKPNGNRLEDSEWEEGYLTDKIWIRNVLLKMHKNEIETLISKRLEG